MAIEIVDLPINSMVIFHSFVVNVTRGYHFLGAFRISSTIVFFSMAQSCTPPELDMWILLTFGAALR
jgi:hypothetical protein